MSLYNGKKFPEYIFKDEKLNILFFEFDICFRTEFMDSFAKYLNSIKVANITIQNIEPDAIVFNRTIGTENLPGEYIDAVRKPIETDYMDTSVNLYMYTELAELYPTESESSFCLVLDRSFDLALMATPKTSYPYILEGFKIENVRKYLSSVMLNKYSKDFDIKLQKNYIK